MKFIDYLKEATTPKLVKQEIVFEPVKARYALDLGTIIKFKVKIGNSVMGYISRDEKGLVLDYNDKLVASYLKIKSTPRLKNSLLNFGSTSTIKDEKLSVIISKLCEILEKKTINSSTEDTYKFFVKDDVNTLIKKYKDFMKKNESKSYVKLNYIKL